MGVLWIPVLAILVLFHQTSMCEKSSVRGGTMMAAPAGVSDTVVVIGAVGESVSFRSSSTDGKAALWSYKDDPIMTVRFEEPVEGTFHNGTFTDRYVRYNVSGEGRVFTISQLRMEDAGTYTVKINGKTSTFTLRVFRELAELTVTCETQNCSGGSCSSSLRCSVPEPSTDFGNVSYTWSLGDHTWDGSSVVLLVNETSQEELEPLMCTARNPVSSRNVTVTTPGTLCAGESRGQVGWADPDP
ncbi:SLAM family member 5-like [Geothlypis trichas]